MKSKHLNKLIEPVRATTGDLAVIFGCSVRSIPRKVENGEIPKPVQVNGKNFWNFQEVKFIAESIFINGE